MAIQIEKIWPDGYPKYEDDEIITRPYSDEIVEQLPYKVIEVRTFTLFGKKFTYKTYVTHNFDSMEDCIEHNKWVVGKPPRAELTKRTEGLFVVEDSFTHNEYEFFRRTEAEIFKAMLNLDEVVLTTQFFRGPENITYAVNPLMAEACSILNIEAVIASNTVNNETHIYVDIPKSVINPCTIPQTDARLKKLLDVYNQYIIDIVYTIEQSELHEIGITFRTHEYRFEFKKVKL